MSENIMDGVDMARSTAIGVFHVANRATFSPILGRDMTSPKAPAARRRQVIGIVFRQASV